VRREIFFTTFRNRLSAFGSVLFMANPRPLDNDPNTLEWTLLQQVFAKAMWTWAHVETETFPIYLAAIGGLGIDMHPVRAAYFAIGSFKLRIHMTTAAIKERWGKDHSATKKWLELSKQCREYDDKRGSIAHLSGHYWSPQKPHQHNLNVLNEVFWHAKSPADWGRAKCEGFSVERLNDLAQKWHKLGYQLNQFGLTLWQEALLPASP
jgi:hypothetical protein